MLGFIFKLLFAESGPPKTHRPYRAPRKTEEYKPLVRKQRVTGRCYVIDGDTIDIKGRRIRLFGIDAPELDHPYGKKAKFFLIRLCKGHVVTAELQGEKSHDREVAVCTLSDGRDLSAEMVEMGLALDWPKYSGGRYKHIEHPDARKRMWRIDARQKGRMPN